MSTVGIIGAGRLGQAMARTARRACRQIPHSLAGVNLIRL